MGIFSKFQIKDIKSKILGARVKQKSDVPAISVIPPTPSTKTVFTFPEHNKQTEKAEHEKERQKSNVRTVSRQRSYSLPDCVDDNIIDSEVNQGCETTAEIPDTKVYLKPPRRARRKRKNRKRSRSCPENLSDSKNIGTACFDAMKTVGSCSDLSSNEDGPSLSDASKPLLPVRSFSQRKMRDDKEENEEFLSEEDQHDEQFCGISSNEDLSDVGFSLNTQDNVCYRSMDSSSSSFSFNNGADMTIKQSISDELSDPGETTPLCAEIAAKSEKCEESSKATLGERIRRRVLKSYRTSPETRWSLDLERLLAGGNQKFSEKDEENWDGQPSNMPPITNGKGIASTWSLDLDNKTKIDCEVERAKSEICVGGSPSVRQKSEGKNCEHGITNAKSLDLDLVSKKERDNSETVSSETMLRTTSLKRGINDYIGKFKFNGIVSKLSTWSLDMEMTRKSSLDGELNDSNRAHSEMLLDVVESEPSKPEKSLSYHTLLYDIDEASKYQIYQSTVYDINDEGDAIDKQDGLPGKPHAAGKSGQYARFISKQFGNLYENSKNLYKHSYAIIDALKQREKELKAIADRQNANTVKQTEQIFKPKSAPRQRSHSYHSNRHQISKTKLK